MRFKALPIRSFRMLGLRLKAKVKVPRSPQCSKLLALLFLPLTAVLAPSSAYAGTEIHKGAVVLDLDGKGSYTFVPAYNFGPNKRFRADLTIGSGSFTSNYVRTVLSCSHVRWCGRDGVSEDFLETDIGTANRSAHSLVSRVPFIWETNRYLNSELQLVGAPGATAQFSFNISAVPEPSTWTMMVVGVGLAGAALRRRKRLIPSRGIKESNARFAEG